MPFNYSLGLSRNFAFTLAEVLITLGIIGIVAAMTIPQLIKNYQGKVLHSQLEKAYSVLSQALQRMNYEEEQTVNAANYGGHKFAPIFIKYFRTVVNCGNNGCELIASNGSSGVEAEEWLKLKNYFTYSKKKNITSSFFDDGQFITSEGMYLLIENVDNLRLFITVDVNGKYKKPNAWGHDLFTFQIMNDGKLLPMGAQGTFTDNLNTFCSAKSSNAQNGLACTQKALTDQKYFQNLP